MSELLHDLLATAFNTSRFKKGYKIELRSSPLSKSWDRAMLKAPASGQVRHTPAHGPLRRTYACATCAAHACATCAAHACATCAAHACESCAAHACDPAP
jgi:hypothetical protein